MRAEANACCAPELATRPEHATRPELATRPASARRRSAFDIAPTWRRVVGSRWMALMAYRFTWGRGRRTLAQDSG
eukprot:3763874-Prymnesium_polylepis.1